MLHRKFYAFLLILALLLAQVGAVRHHVDHLSDFDTSSQQQDADEKYASLCEKCIQYDSLEQGLSASATKVFVALLGYQDLSQVARNFISSFTRLYTARAPPSLVKLPHLL